MSPSRSLPQVDQEGTRPHTVRNLAGHEANLKKHHTSVCSAGSHLARLSQLTSVFLRLRFLLSSEELRKSPNASLSKRKGLPTPTSTTTESSAGSRLCSVSPGFPTFCSLAFYKAKSVASQVLSIYSARRHFRSFVFTSSTFPSRSLNRAFPLLPPSQLRGIQEARE